MFLVLGIKIPKFILFLGDESENVWELDGSVDIRIWFTDASMIAKNIKGKKWNQTRNGIILVMIFHLLSYDVAFWALSVIAFVISSSSSSLSF